MTHVQLRSSATELREVVFDGTYAGWRAAARAALACELAPSNIVWRLANEAQTTLLDVLPLAAEGARSRYTVPKDFLELAADVACYRDPARWNVLYRVLWRITHGERALLDVYVDLDVYALRKMAKTIRREAHKMRAFVRFRRIEGDGGERYVAWFEPEHDVVEREAPFFSRRFPAMLWAILTPGVVASWDGEKLSYSPGVPREMAPNGDDLENLWRTYYAHIFNPARVKTRMMRSEMAVRYWKNLPEARIIAPLVRDAPSRVFEMIERAEREALIPGGERPERTISAASEPLPVDAGVAAARTRSDRARALVAQQGSAASDLVSRGIRIGVASWTDPTMTAPGVFYPDGQQSAESRLRYYASRFSLVEVDSTYYAMPSEKIAALWMERTPADFMFDVKAHALMTGHSTRVARLPADLQDSLPARLRTVPEIDAKQVPAEFVDEIWRRFHAALAPLREGGKLGALLLQLPRDFLPSRVNREMIAGFRERAGSDLCAVEFRHRSWLADEQRTRETMALLREYDLGYVMVDAPLGFETSMPALADVTSERIAVVRMHGRRTDTWERAVDIVSERYRYLYEITQLQEWIPRIIDVAYRTQGVHVVMNNCHANYGTANADEITAMLIEADELRRV